MDPNLDPEPITGITTLVRPAEDKKPNWPVIGGVAALVIAVGAAAYGLGQLGANKSDTSIKPSVSASTKAVAKATAIATRTPSATPTPTPTPTPKATAAPTPAPTPILHYTSADALKFVQNIFGISQANAGAYYEAYKSSFDPNYASFLDSHRAGYDPLLCAQNWPPPRGMSYGTPSEPDLSIQNYNSSILVHQLWGGGEEALESVSVDLRTLKIDGIICNVKQ